MCPWRAAASGSLPRSAHLSPGASEGELGEDGAASDGRGALVGWGRGRARPAAPGDRVETCEGSELLSTERRPYVNCKCLSGWGRALVSARCFFFLIFERRPLVHFTCLSRVSLPLMGAALSTPTPDPDAPIPEHGVRVSPGLFDALTGHGRGAPSSSSPPTGGDRSSGGSGGAGSAGLGSPSSSGRGAQAGRPQMRYGREREVEEARLSPKVFCFLDCVRRSLPNLHVLYASIHPSIHTPTFSAQPRRTGSPSPSPPRLRAGHRPPPRPSRGRRPPEGGGGRDGAGGRARARASGRPRGRAGPGHPALRARRRRGDRLLRGRGGVRDGRCGRGDRLWPSCRGVRGVRAVGLRRARLGWRGGCARRCHRPVRFRSTAP